MKQKHKEKIAEMKQKHEDSIDSLTRQLKTAKTKIYEEILSHKKEFMITAGEKSREYISVEYVEPLLEKKYVEPLLEKIEKLREVCNNLEKLFDVKKSEAKKANENLKQC